MDPATAAELLGDELDEWQWPESCGELRQIESSLRCLICGEFYHGPVVLPCSHTFCSECVRRFLQSRGNSGCCPECKQPCVPGDLVANRSLEKIGVLFQQMKPKVLPLLAGAKVKKVASQTADDSKSKRGTGAADNKPAERMPLLSYNVMKDKEIKKLLESINIRASIKNREDIIQIHKEYVLLANAQADSSHPKSAKQIRDEVMRNYRARQQEKQFGLGGSGSNNRKSLETAAPGAPVSAEMQAGFQRLIEQMKNRGKKQAVQKSEPLEQDDEDDEDDDEYEYENGSREGVWRHVHALKTDQEFYIHSVTNEIRLEPPREFLDHQKRLKEEPLKREEESIEVVDEESTVPASKPESVSTIAIDDDDDFEIITSPPPKPPLGSKQSTPQSASSSAGKKGKRRASISSSMNSVRLFSQDSSASFQETATQMAPSASLSFPGSNTDADDDAASATQLSADLRWECPRCTLVNEGPGLTECEACGHQHRPARKKPKMQFQRKIFSSLSQDLR